MLLRRQASLAVKPLPPETKNGKSNSNGHANSAARSADPILDPYKELGFLEVGRTGQQVFGDCVLCGARNKLYINWETGLFSCKVCGEEGNQYQFFSKYLEHCKTTYPQDIKKVAVHRQLPVEVIRDAQITWNGDQWILPVFNLKGTCVNLRRFSLQEKIVLYNLPGLSSQLWGVHRLSIATRRVIVCEGEWDAMAAIAMLLADKNNRDAYRAKKIVVIALPGAKTWKPQWNTFLEGREVVLIFDNDTAGRGGLKKTHRILEDGDIESQFVGWGNAFPEGYDLRDFYKNKGTWSLLLELIQTKPTWAPAPDSDDNAANPRYHGDRPSFDEVLRAFRKWLHMTPEHETVLKIVFATVLCNRLPGDPLWLYIVGSPGFGKTEILMATSTCADVVTASAVTPHSLVSGWNGAGAKDPSLIPSLIGNVFILKDFTEVLDMPKTFRDEVYSIFRGAYDGLIEKKFGNGVNREYKGYFSFLAGVTYAIDRDSDTTMGERFLKYRMQVLDNDVRYQMIMETLRNTGHELQMKEELQEISKKFLDPFFPGLDEIEFDQETQNKIYYLAELVALMRCSVDRDRYHRDRLGGRPNPEVGTRLAKQFKKLLIGLAGQREDMEISEEDFEIVRKVALHTCIPFYLEIVRQLVKCPGDTEDGIGYKAKIPKVVLKEYLEAMEYTGIVERRREEDLSGRFNRYKTLWYLSDDCERKWKMAGVA